MNACHDIGQRSSSAFLIVYFWCAPDRIDHFFGARGGQKNTRSRCVWVRLRSAAGREAIAQLEGPKNIIGSRFGMHRASAQAFLCAAIIIDRFKPSTFEPTRIVGGCRQDLPLAPSRLIVRSDLSCRSICSGRTCRLSCRVRRARPRTNHAREIYAVPRCKAVDRHLYDQDGTI